MKNTLATCAFLTFLLSSASAETPSIAEQISHIEQTIRSRVAVIGEEDKAYSIEQRMAHFNVPGISIAVVNDGRIAWAKGYGQANAQTRVDPNTLFQAGSISKPIAALAVMKLVAQGKVDLDENINRYLKSWSLSENTFTSSTPLTLRHLLTHTGGTTVHGFPGYAQPTIPSTQGVLNGKGNTPAVAVDTVPGSQWRYSGGGYTLMQLVVEDVTGESFEQFIDDSVLLPLGLTQSTYQQPIDTNKFKNVSFAFDDKGNVIADGWHHYPEKAAAGLWTTPSDVAKYILAMQQKTDRSLPLNEKMVEMILSHHLGNWGLGPEIETSGDIQLFSHGGKNAGFTNHFFATVDGGEGVVVMANGDNAHNLIQEIEIAISTYYGWNIKNRLLITPVTLSEKQLAEFTGQFELDVDMPDMGPYRVTISHKNGRLWVDDRNQDSISELVATDEYTFINVASGSSVVFERSDNGAMGGFVWSGEWPFKKVSEHK